MVLRIRARRGKLFLDYKGLSRIYSYVAVIGGGQKFRTETVTDKNGGKQPEWEQTLVFPRNPPNIKLEVWIQHPDGDILAGEILIDLCKLYERQPYRIQPKMINLVSKGKSTGEIKVELDFDFDGMNKEHLNKMKQEGVRSHSNEGKKHQNNNNLQIGTVIAQGDKKAQLNKIKQQQNNHHQFGNILEEKPYQKPPTAPLHINIKPSTGKKQQHYDYHNNPWEAEYNKKNQNHIHQHRPQNRDHNKGNNLFQVFGNINNKKPSNNGWDL